MPGLRAAGSDIQSWTPAIDARGVENGNIYTLNGKNYCFDSKGPKTLMGSTVLDGGSLGLDDQMIQSLDVGNRVIIMAGSGIYEHRDEILTDIDGPLPGEYWATIADLAILPASTIGQNYWTSAYLSHGTYICHPVQGMFRLLSESIQKYDAIGVPDKPQAVAETSGRLVIVDPFTVYWSGPVDAEDLTPELAGAGFQVLSERVAGKPIALTTFQGGFIVWTDAGQCLLGEYVGGDAVFRFDRIKIDQSLIGPGAWASTPDGDQLIMSKQGIFKTDAGRPVKPATPVFNEFLRDLMHNGPFIDSRLDYIAELDMLFVQLIDTDTFFTRTFVLSVNLDKWGTFDENHKGICRFRKQRGWIGYFGLDGYGHQWNDIPWTQQVDGSYAGIDSHIDIGYLRPTELMATSDAILEIQGVNLSAIQSMPADGNEELWDWNYPGLFTNFIQLFYSQDENYNNFNASSSDENWGDSGYANEDWGQSNGHVDVNWNVHPNQTLDFNWGNPGQQENWNATPVGGYDIESITEDWNYKLDGDEDWTGDYSFLNVMDYDIVVSSSFDGNDEILTTPELAYQKANSEFWTLISSGQYHILRIGASQEWQKYHVKQLSTTILYQGRLA